MTQSPDDPITRTREIAMHSIAQYIIDRTGLFAWTDDEPLMQAYKKDFVIFVIETCAALGAKTGMA